MGEDEPRALLVLAALAAALYAAVWIAAGPPAWPEATAAPGHPPAATMLADGQGR